MKEDDLKKGFNNGYMLKASAPKLADKFADIFSDILAKGEDEYAKGFIAGLEEREKEMPELKRRNYTVKRSIDISKSKQKTKDKDKDFRDI